jgi:hypothetical protein
MMKKIFFPIAMLLILTCSFTQKNINPDTEYPRLNDSTLFDFWLGDWEAQWFEKDSVKAYGENHIRKELKGFVISENFHIRSGSSKGFEGSSWSVYDKNKQKWFQTWVDNSGAYMTFEAKLDGSTRIFERSTINKKGTAVLQRMKFRDIKKDSFTWDWESSLDGGKTWSMNWQIFYTRKK